MYVFVYMVGVLLCICMINIFFDAVASCLLFRNEFFLFSILTKQWTLNTERSTPTFSLSFKWKVYVVDVDVYDTYIAYCMYNCTCTRYESVNKNMRAKRQRFEVWMFKITHLKFSHSSEFTCTLKHYCLLIDCHFHCNYHSIVVSV